MGNVCAHIKCSIKLKRLAIQRLTFQSIQIECINMFKLFVRLCVIQNIVQLSQSNAGNPEDAQRASTKHFAVAVTVTKIPQINNDSKVKR